MFPQNAAQSNRYEEALDCFRQAAKRGKDKAWMDRLNAGIMLLALKQFREGIKEISLVLKTHPNNVNALYQTGRAYNQLGQANKAVCWFVVRHLQDVILVPSF